MCDLHLFLSIQNLCVLKLSAKNQNCVKHMLFRCLHVTRPVGLCSLPGVCAETAEDGGGAGVCGETAEDGGGAGHKVST